MSDHLPNLNFFSSEASSPTDNYTGNQSYKYERTYLYECSYGYAGVIKSIKSNS